MRLEDFGVLADENIHDEVVAFLRSRGFDVRTVRGSALQGHDDVDLVRLAHTEHRIVVTHDRDFGRLAIAEQEPLWGIVYLRPGHIVPRFTVGTLGVLLLRKFDVDPPFILVARRRGAHVQVRLRHLG